MTPAKIETKWRQSYCSGGMSRRRTHRIIERAAWLLLLFSLLLFDNKHQSFSSSPSKSSSPPAVVFWTLNAFTVPTPPRSNRKPHENINYLTTALLLSNRGNNDSGYQFGDLTRGVIGRFQKRVNSLTGKSQYEFGDLSRWVDGKVKDRVEEYTGKAVYQFGDMTRETVRRLVDGEYDREDLVLLLKIAATIGVNLQPVASVLPMKVLMDLLNLSLEASIAQTVGEKVIRSITNEIDARMKEMVTGDRNYKVGDFTKRIVNRWTGKEAYEFGDVTKNILGILQQRDGAGSARPDSSIAEQNIPDGSIFTNDSIQELDQAERNALDEWDKEFFQYQRSKEGLAPPQDEDLYRDWDERYLSSQSNDKR